MQLALGQTFAFKRKKLRVPVSVLTTLSFDGHKMCKKNKKPREGGICLLLGGGGDRLIVVRQNPILSIK